MEPTEVPQIVIVRVEPEQPGTGQHTPEQPRQCSICKPVFYMEKGEK